MLLFTMHKTLSVLLVIALLLPQSSTASDKCNDDHTSWAEDATAEQQVEYIDSMLGHGVVFFFLFWFGVGWGSLPTHEVLVDLWPVYRNFRASMLHFSDALAGLSPQKANRLLTELDEHMDYDLQNMAVVHHCCGVVNN